MPLFTVLAAILALVGLPLFLVIFAVTLLSQRAAGLQAPVMFVEIFDKITENPVFMTIPLFAHAGFVLSESRTPERLVRLSRAALGWLPGGSSLVAIVVCALFTAFTGASGVTIIAVGGLLLPVLTKEGYPERFNLGLLTTCGSLGLLFPPSLPLIIFALIASNIAPVAVDTLFLAGLVPGVLLMGVLAIYGGAVCGRFATRERQPFEIGELLRATGAAIFELPIPFIIIVGIFGGFLTLAQAAAVVALYVSFIEVFVYRDLKCQDLAKVTVHAMVLVGGILVIIMAALAMTNFLTDQEIPRQILAAMREHIQSPLSFLLVLNIFLLVVGCLMDIYSAILVVVPLVMPIALDFGVDPVHLGIIFLTNLEIGYSTPPVGINLFISSLRFKKPVVTLYKASLPFLGLLVICLGLITYVPALSLSVVRWVEGTSTVDLRWSPRGGPAQGAGTGTLTWIQRDQDSELEWEDFGTVSADANPAAFDDLTLRYREGSGLQAGSWFFELGRSAEDGATVQARWSIESAAPEAAAGGTFVLEDALETVMLVPDLDRFRAMGVAAENWTAAELSLESMADGRAKGELRAVLLWFPEDPDEPEQLYDLVLPFDVPTVLDDPEPRPVGADGEDRRIPDVRLVRRDLDDGGATFSLERTRDRPWSLSATWTVDAEALETMSGSSFDLSRLKILIEALPEEELPLREGLFGGSVVEIESATDDQLKGVLRAVVRDPASQQSYDLELAFELDAG